MKRRILALALLFVTLHPLAARATDATADPNGLTAPAPDLALWLDSALRVVLAWLGV